MCVCVGSPLSMRGGNGRWKSNNYRRMFKPRAIVRDDKWCGSFGFGPGGCLPSTAPASSIIPPASSEKGRYINIKKKNRNPNGVTTNEAIRQSGVAAMPAVKYSNRTIKSNLPSCVWETLKEVPRKAKGNKAIPKNAERKKKTNNKNLSRKISPTSNFFACFFSRFRSIWLGPKVKQKLSKEHKRSERKPKTKTET